MGCENEFTGPLSLFEPLALSIVCLRGAIFHTSFFLYPHSLSCFLVLKMYVFCLLKDKKREDIKREVEKSILLFNLRSGVRGFFGSARER